MNTNVSLDFKTNYHMELIDSRTNHVKQRGDFHNIPIICFYSLLTCHESVRSATYFGTESNQYAGCFNMLNKIGVGSGTAEPAFSDTALSEPLWSVTASSVTHEWLDDYTLRGSATYTFPASTAYVGAVSEVGLYGLYRILSSASNTNLVTRALLKDSEGQQIVFNKTDLDILTITVTVDMSLRSADDNFTIFRKPSLAARALGYGRSYGNTYAYVQGHLNLCRFDYDLQQETAPDIDSITTVIDKPLISTTKAYVDSTSAYNKLTASRLLSSDVTNETYYRAVAIPGIGYWQLPNENLFPAYTIEGISIGTGDGTTTVFENPINYFKEGTEKVYKNGIQLTRDTDYTIYHIGNKDCLPELAQIKAPSKVSSSVNITSYNLQVYPLLIPTAHTGSSYLGFNSYLGFKSAKEYDVTKQTPAFSSSAPLYIEYEEAVTLNCLKCTGGLKGIISPNSYYDLPTGTTFYLDYSIDGDVYTEVGSANTTATNGVFTLDFNSTTAKYWRIRTSYTSRLIAMPRSDSTEYFFTLNRKEPDIVFTTAPADGDVLTMDVDMDMIMKNENFVVDVSARIDFLV